MIYAAVVILLLLLGNAAAWVIVSEDRRVLVQRLRGAEALNAALERQLRAGLSELPLYEGDAVRNLEFSRPVEPCEVCGRPVLRERRCERHQAA